MISIVAVCLILYSAQIGRACAVVGTAFTYQGHLYDTNYAANGLYDFSFKLFGDPCTGSQIGGDVNRPDIDVIDAYFTVELDFNEPNAFNGDARWLEIGVRPGEQNDPNTYTILEPRQKITAAPYSSHALTTKWNGISGIPSGFADNIDNEGVTVESDPTVTGSVKDGVDWNEVGSRPAGLDDGDDVGITVESDPTVPENVKDGVDWSDVADIPAGFADNIDNVGDPRTKGTATVVVACPNAPLEIRNLADYQCDGTADDVEINAAIDYVNTLGGGVVHLAGNYFCTSATITPLNGITLEGDGLSTVIKSNGFADEIIQNYDTTNGNEDITIRDLKIDASLQDNNRNALPAIIYFQKVTRGKVTNVHIICSPAVGYRDAGDGIRFTHYSTQCQIQNVVIDGGMHNIFLGNGVSYITVSDVISRNPHVEHLCLEHKQDETCNSFITVNNLVGYNSSQHGVYIDESYNVTLSNIAMYKTNNNGLLIYRNVHDVTISNSIWDTWKGNLKNGIYLHNSNVSKVNISNCIFKNPTAFGIYSDADDVIVSNCRINGAYAGGLYLTGDRNTISNCIIDTVTNAAGKGFWVGGNYVTIDNCIIKDIGSSGTGAYGVYTNGCENVIVRGCLFDGVCGRIYYGPTTNKYITFADNIIGNYSSEISMIINGENILIQGNSWANPGSGTVIIGETTFTGSGLSDCNSMGSFTGYVNTDYKVEIDGTGTPDTFKWSDDGGSTWDNEEVPILGTSPSSLNNGVKIRFDHSTDHTLGDYWEFSVTIHCLRFININSSAANVRITDNSVAAPCSSAYRIYDAGGTNIEVEDNLEPP